jgi:hypothetical protein
MIQVFRDEALIEALTNRIDAVNSLIQLEMFID